MACLLPLVTDESRKPTFPLKCGPNKNSTFCLVLGYVIRSMEPLSFRSSLFALENSVGEASGCLQSKHKEIGEETSFENNKTRFSSVQKKT